MDIKEQISQQTQSLEKAVADALEMATQTADAAEVAITKTTGISVTSHLCEVENVEFNRDGALGITVYNNHRKGSASTSDLSPEAIKKAVNAALEIAKYTSPDPYAAPAPKEMMVKEIMDLDLLHPDNPTPDEAASKAIEAEQAALNYHSKVNQSDGASYDSHYGVKVYGNSHGLIASRASSRHSISCSVIGVGENQAMERDYSYSIARHKDDLLSAKEVGLQAAQKTFARLDARQLKTGQYPVLFQADVATGLLGHLISAISGSNLYRSASFLLDSLNKQIFPDWFNIEENPHIKRALASSAFDSEGVATTHRQIIQDGTLQTYLLPSYAARKLNMTPTGHAGGIYNWLITSNNGQLEEMLKTLGTGLMVTELMGQGVNVVTGDYSRGAAGFWVENGKIQYPVSEITIAGNLKDMFKNIIAVGRDIETRSQIQTGSILIESMKVAGA